MKKFWNFIKNDAETELLVSIITANMPPDMVRRRDHTGFVQR